jgi:hypothetical protein
MITVVFWFIVFYLLFRFIFGFVVPLVTAGRQIRTKMKDVHENMQDFRDSNNSETYAANNGSTKQSNSNASMGDYIDFEEIK